MSACVPESTARRSGFCMHAAWLHKELLFFLTTLIAQAADLASWAAHRNSNSRPNALQCRLFLSFLVCNRCPSGNHMQVALGQSAACDVVKRMVAKLSMHYSDSNWTMFLVLLAGVCYHGSRLDRGCKSRLLEKVLGYSDLVVPWLLASQLARCEQSPIIASCFRTQLKFLPRPTPSS